MSASSTTSGPLFRRAAHVEAAPMQQETILFNSLSNKFCLLNPSAATVWNHLESPADADTLAVAICAAYDGVTMDQARLDVAAALEEFRSLALIEPAL